MGIFPYGTNYHPFMGDEQMMIKTGDLPIDLPFGNLT
jgi:hypothetical protein